MNPNMPTLGVRFDIDKAGGGLYGLACWKIMWRAIPKIGISYLYEGDTANTLNGLERVFLIVVQSPDSAVITRIKAALTHNDALKRVCANPMFIDDPATCATEPLPYAGMIDAEGNLVGDAETSVAFAALKKERTTKVQ